MTEIVSQLGDSLSSRLELEHTGGQTAAQSSGIVAASGFTTIGQDKPLSLHYDNKHLRCNTVVISSDNTWLICGYPWSFGRYIAYTDHGSACGLAQRYSLHPTHLLHLPPSNNPLPFTISNKYV